MAGNGVVPDLAQHVPRPEQGGTVYRFRIRPGVRYAAGRPVLAGDVRASVERLHRMDAFALTGFPLGLRGEDRCDRTACDLSDGIATDDRTGTVTFRLNAANPDFLAHLATPIYSVLPAGTPHRVLDTELIGTGPYRVSRATPDELVLDRNPRFRPWSRVAQPPGFPDRIEWRLTPTGDELEHADLRYEQPSPRRIRQLAMTEPRRVQLSPGPGIAYLSLNTRAAPLDQAAARAVVATAIDRRRLGELTLGDDGAPTCRMLPPAIAGYAPGCLLPRGSTPSARGDIPAARALVERSGTRGARVVVAAPSDRPASVAAARLVARRLGAVGWRVEIDASQKLSGDPPPGPFPEHLMRSRRPVIGVVDWYADLPAPSKVLVPIGSCASRGGWSPQTNNTAGWCDAGLDELMTRAHALEQTAPADAARLWEQADRRLVASGAVVPVASLQQRTVTGSRVGNFQVHPVTSVLVSQMWVR